MPLDAEQKKAKERDRIKALRAKQKSEGFCLVQVKVPKSKKDELKKFAEKLVNKHSKGK